MTAPGKQVVEPEEKGESWVDTFRAIFWAAVIALGIRHFVVEPFKIPSGSMIPTLLVGDYVLVSKFGYGVRLPFVNTEILDLGDPERGDVIVFRYPDDPDQDFIKRIVGMPGDRVEMRQGRLHLNGQPVDRVADGEFAYVSTSGQTIETRRYTERNPEGREYTVIRMRELPGPLRTWIVPEDSYFMMGDNRDNSSDSRAWRNHFVHADQIKGRAFCIHWSWRIDSGPSADRGFVADLLHTLWKVVTFQVEEIRWRRIGRSLDGLAEGAGNGAIAPAAGAANPPED